MKTTLSGLTCLCFMFGTAVLCDKKLEKRQKVSFCSGNEETFNCSNGLCIDSSLTCDGHADCSDGSDETRNLCTQLFRACPSYAFRCNYGACVDKSAKCNGKNDCVDGSDENLPECTQSSQHIKGSTCLENEYNCKSGQCIDSTSTCDGVRDCPDGSDETRALCQTFQCPKHTFKCTYGACISKLSKCDGIKQCADGSDEELCNTWRPTLKPTTATRPIKITPSPIKPTTQSNEKKTCVIPNREGSIYYYNNTDHKVVLSPGTKVDQDSIVKEECEEGYYKSDSDTSMVCMRTGQWFPSSSGKSCLKMCPPIISDNLDIECTRNGDPVNCSNPSIPGTTLRPRCKLTHSVPNGAVESQIELLCRRDGIWNGRLYTCVPNCGRLFTQSRPLIANGVKAQYGTAPWNVGVYRMNDMICGGTLIAPNLVVSAAHCFWEQGMSERILTNNGLYKIAVGKYDRNISVMDNQFTKIIDVGLIYLKDTYLDITGLYADDIAVVVLVTKVEINIAVLPVCMDWSSRYTVSNGFTGKIVGWGKTENMTPSQSLLEAALPYIDQFTCRNRYRNKEFEKFVTGDKFCAGSQMGGVQEGDSGAGLTYEHGNLYYLTGVVSNKNPDANDTIALFTDVSQHVQWISNIFTNYTSSQNEDVSRANKMIEL